MLYKDFIQYFKNNNILTSKLCNDLTILFQNIIVQFNTFRLNETKESHTVKHPLAQGSYSMTTSFPPQRKKFVMLATGKSPSPE